MKTALPLMIRIILGGAFLFSAYAKLFPIETFELLLLQQGITTWEIVPFFSRILIASEAMLGILIILGIYRKTVLKITAGILIVFTLYILFLLVKYGSEADCGCMGDMIKMNPFESILKNAIMLGLALYLLRFQSYEFTFKPMWATLLLGIVIYPLPFIINPPDSYFASKGEGQREYTIKIEDLNEVVIGDQKPDFYKGNYILAFFSVSCPHCRLASSKLELIKNEVPDLPPIYIIFSGKKEKIPEFLKETKSSHPYYHMDDKRKFIKLTHGSFPTILYLKDGKVAKHFTPFELDPVSIKNAITTE